MGSLLYKRWVDVNDKIKVYIPTVGEIMDNEDEYYHLVSTFCATPYDMMVQLDDMGVDFSTVKNYDLFCLLMGQLQNCDTHLIFGDFPFRSFESVKREDTGENIWVSNACDAVIDKSIYFKIAQTLRSINFMDKQNKIPGNEEARKYMIERARIKLKRKAKKKQSSSQLEDLIIAMVNASEYKYDFVSTKELTIFQFQSCVRQVIRKVNFDNIMIGVYAGTVRSKDINPDQLNWITSSKK